MVLDVERQQLLRYPVRQGLASGGEGSSITPLGGLAERITSMTTVGDTVVAMTDDGVVVFDVGDADAAATAAASPVDVGEAGVAVLAQPAPEGSPIVGVRRRRLGRADRPRKRAQSSAETGAVVDLAAIGAGGPLAPIVHQGCVFTVGTEPPTFTRICHGVADQTAALTGADPGGAAVAAGQRLGVDQRLDQRHDVDRRHRHRVGADRRLGQRPRVPTATTPTRSSRATTRRPIPRRTPTSVRSATRRSTRTGSTNRRSPATTSPAPGSISRSSSTSSPTTRIPTATP